MRIGNEQNGLLMRMLNASVERDRVISSNISNINTPGYKRRELHFEDLVREATAGGRDADHIKPEITVDTTTPGRIDGNNVIMETEVGLQRENRLMYETYVTMLQGQLRMLGSAIRGSGA